MADVIYSQGYDPREFHNLRSMHEENIFHGRTNESIRDSYATARMEKMHELNANGSAKSTIDS